MGLPEFLGSLFKAISPLSMSDSPTCARCLNCKARIKTLPSGMQVRVFTCPYTGEYDSFESILPSVNPSDPATYADYSEKYKDNLSSIYTYKSDCTEQPGGMSPLKNNEYKPICSYNELKYATNNLYNCGHFKPCLNIDNSGSYYLIDNEMLYTSSFGDTYYDNLSEEDKQSLMLL